MIAVFFATLRFLGHAPLLEVMVMFFYIFTLILLLVWTAENFKFWKLIVALLVPGCVIFAVHWMFKFPLLANTISATNTPTKVNPIGWTKDDQSKQDIITFDSADGIALREAVNGNNYDLSAKRFGEAYTISYELAFKYPVYWRTSAIAAEGLATSYRDGGKTNAAIFVTQVRHDITANGQRFPPPKTAQELYNQLINGNALEENKTSNQNKQWYLKIDYIQCLSMRPFSEGYPYRLMVYINDDEVVTFPNYLMAYRAETNILEAADSIPLQKGAENYSIAFGLMKLDQDGTATDLTYTNATFTPRSGRQFNTAELPITAATNHTRLLRPLNGMVRVVYEISTNR